LTNSSVKLRTLDGEPPESLKYRSAAMILEDHACGRVDAEQVP